MSDIKLLLINTIGLTGADLLLPKLSKYEEIAILPGQNFSVFKDNLYRVHDYKGWKSSDIFNSLARNLYTKQGRMWMGLTKFMKDEDRSAYPKDLHKEIFSLNLKDSRDFVDIIKTYILAYYEACGLDFSERLFASWFSNNVLLNHNQYNKFDEEVKVIHVSCSISRWLTHISQTKTWDCSKSIKFWLVNNLYALAYSLEKGNTLIINTDELLSSEEDLMNKIEKFLSLKKVNNSQALYPGFLLINNNIIEEQEKLSKQIDKIYKDNGLYKLASSFEDWSADFVKKDNVKEMLGNFSKFWNSTCHTNLDWIGPIGDQIIEEVIKFTEVKNERNFSYTFYHEYFELNSDHYDQVNVNLNHFLGCLEDQIVLPLLPFFIRICIQYLSSSAENCMKSAHSYVSFKQGKIYKTLITDEFQIKISNFGLRKNFENLEDLILEAEKTCKQ